MIDHDAFVEWAENHFDSVIVHKDEVKINDIWWTDEAGLPDSSNKCWINTTKGCFRAFKSGKSGSVIQLVSEIEGCTWEDAARIVGCHYVPQDFEAKLAKMFAEEEQQQINHNKVALPSNTYLISQLSNNNPFRIQSESYLSSRKIPIDGLYICTSGEYRNRIIIPYYNRERTLIYWNGRDISGKAKARYRGPDKEVYGIGKSDVIWMDKWPANGSRIYLTEGEFDAMSICATGLFGGACGSKNVSDKQIELLRGYKIVFCFDNDKAGKDWLNVAEQMSSIGFSTIEFVRPPVMYKDWNLLLQETNEKVLFHYITNQKRILTPDLVNILRMENI